MRKFLKIQGKIVGDYDNVTHTYHKQVKRAIHRMWKYDAYGIQSKVVQELRDLGCVKVLIYELDTDETWESDFDQWLHTDLIAEFGDHGKQRFVPVKQMKHSWGKNSAKHKIV